MRNNEAMDLLWVGKFDFRKQLGLALKVMAELKEYPKIHLNVLGAGHDEENLFYRQMADRLGVSGAVTFHGKMVHDHVLDMMRKADLFFFTSILDETSTVILEALGCLLPVVCFDACGFGPVITPDVGRRIPFSNPDASVKDFKRAILELYSQPELLKRMSANCVGKCETLTWGYKAEQMMKLYKKVV